MFIDTPSDWVVTACFCILAVLAHLGIRKETRLREAARADVAGRERRRV